MISNTITERNETSIAVGRRIRLAREEADLTQAELADKINMDCHELEALEDGHEIEGRRF